MWQPVLMINGYLISVLGLAMLIPAFLDMYWTRAGWSHFLSSSIICLFIGLSLFLANRMNIKKITLQQGVFDYGLRLGEPDFAGNAPFFALWFHSSFCRCFV